MVALPEVKTVEEAEIKSYDNFLVEDGRYQAVIVKSEWVDPFSKGDPNDLLLTGAITAGKYKDKEFEVRCGILNHNPIKSDNPTFTWSVAGYGTLAAISKAIGRTHTPRDSSELHNQPFVIETSTKKGTPYIDKDGNEKMGYDKSVIKKYLPSATGVSAVNPAPMPNPALAQAHNNAQAVPAQVHGDLQQQPLANNAQTQGQNATQVALNPFAPPQ